MTTIINFLNNVAEWSSNSSVFNVTLSDLSGLVTPLYYLMSGAKYLLSFAAG
ncbi:MAG: hypothetical protein Q3972_00305 [Corynebacterium sp.]|nr:hypothetical protein [Corynebacterium sp.]